MASTGVDAQGWKLLNIDKQCVFIEYCCSHPTNDLQELFNHRHEINDLIRVPQWAPMEVSHAAVASAKASCDMGSFTRLPQELIDEVISNLDSSTDITCLALTCSYFFRLLAASAQAALKADQAPWAGDRLILIGINAISEPENLLLYEDIADISTKIPPCFNNPGERLFYLDGLGYSPQHGLMTAGIGALQDIRGRVSGSLMDAGALDQAERLLAMLMCEVDRGGFVLRNLTTKQYLEETDLTPSYFRFQFHHILLHNIHWTDYPQWLGLGLYKHGDWAGHRFDIATIKDVQGEDWHNVGGCVAAELSRLAESVGLYEHEEESGGDLEDDESSEHGSDGGGCDESD